MASGRIGEALDDAPAPGPEHFPCTVIGQAEVEELLGNPTEPASYSLETVDDPEGPFEADTCSWLSFAENANEISLQLSAGERFPGGEVVCRGPRTEDTPDAEGGDEASEAPTVVYGEPRPIHEPIPVPVDGLGYRAWWTFDPAIALGHLLVCDPRARITIEVSTAEELAARRAAITLARRALETI